jgi:hypothetical protein
MSKAPGYMDMAKMFKKMQFRIVKKDVTFLTATTGAIAVKELFTVTGTVIAAIFGVCTADLTGATATIEAGVSTDTDLFILTTTGTTIDVGELLSDATPFSAKLLSTLLYAIIQEVDIGYEVKTAAIDTGAITFYCLWIPISADGNVVAAGVNAAL